MTKRKSTSLRNWKLSKRLYILLCVAATCMPQWGLSGQMRKAVAETELNDLQQIGWTIQHSSLSYDKQTIVFSARKSGSTEYDLYIAKRNGAKWSSPEPLTNANSAYDELFPSISSDENRIFFVRHIPAKPNDKKSTDTYSIYVTTREGGKWDNPQTIVISNGHDISPLIMPDNRTLLFASNRPTADKKEQNYAIYYTRQLDKHNWYLPEELLRADEKNVNYYGLTIDDKASVPTVRFTKQVCNRKDTVYSTEFFPLPAKCHPQPVKTITGTIKDLENKNYIAGVITVYDAITSQEITTLSNQGRYTIALPVGLKYIVDVTSQGYSHEYIEYDCTDLAHDTTETEHILLSKTLQIHVNVFDAETQMPLSHVQCQPKQYVRPNANGVDISLPIGNIYTIQFSKQGYAPNELTINTKKEVLLPSSELDIDLLPGKAPLKVQLYDLDSHQPVSGNIGLSNQDREEEIEYADLVLVRQGNSYLAHICATGYYFIDTLLTIPYNTTLQNHRIGLRSIKEKETIQLKNIQFEYNSASLLESSYAELEKVISLLKANPSLRIELAAHTDDFGTDAYNNKLSQRRGEVVRKYLVKHGIASERVTAVGYGKKQPLVPNDSDENRAINRRVEFKVTGI